MNKKTGKKLEEKLSSLEASIIIKYENNLHSHQITLDLVRINKDLVDMHKVIFDGVTAYFFVVEEGKRRFHPPFWERAELTEILFIRDGRDKISQKNTKEIGKPEYTVYANFWLDIWSSVLMIEANQITIDGEIFEVGYPVN